MNVDRNPGAEVVTRTISVSRGLFVFRYEKSRAGRFPPAVTLTVPDHGAAEIITADPAHPPELRNPGDAFVIRALRDTSVVAHVSPSVAAGSTDAHFVLEKLTQSEPITPAQRESGWIARPSYEDVSSPLVLAHVARRGDVQVNPGEWICGPALPMAIEGLEIVWPDRPPDVDIIVACTVNDRGRRTCAPVPSGHFIGTRGKAAPIVALSLSVLGPASLGLRLVCEALFLGDQVSHQEGANVEFSGPTGREPLVGFRLALTSAHAAAPVQHPSAWLARQAEAMTHAAPIAPARVQTSPTASQKTTTLMPASHMPLAPSSPSPLRPQSVQPNVLDGQRSDVQPASETGLDLATRGLKSGRVRVFRAAKASVPQPIS